MHNTVCMADYKTIKQVGLFLKKYIIDLFLENWKMK